MIVETVTDKELIAVLSQYSYFWYICHSVSRGLGWSNILLFTDLSRGKGGREGEGEAHFFVFEL